MNNHPVTKEDLIEVLKAHEEREHHQISEALNSHLVSDQHLFIAAWMKKEQRKQELWEKVKVHVVSVGVVAVVAFLLAAFWNEFVSALPFVKRS